MTKSIGEQNLSAGLIVNIAWKAAFSAALAVLLFTLPACQGLYPQQRKDATSVVDFLYPSGERKVVTPSIPVLKLPVTVGIAFVPGRDGRETMPEARKNELMDMVSADFENLEFVREIKRVPSPYLKPKGGFDNLDQIKTMFGCDVIVLLSYDQIQHTDEGFLSILYWTLVGAYMVKGEKNDTSTMMDAAVFDISSRKLLFRAPGMSRVKGSATPVNLSEELRSDSEEGFKLATAEMKTNLKFELDRFKEKVKTKPEEYKVVHTQDYRGGGSLELPFALAVCGLAISAAVLGRGRRED